MRSEQNQEPVENRRNHQDLSLAAVPDGLLSRLAGTVASGILRLTRFALGVIDTNVSDMEAGFLEGGTIEVRQISHDYRGDKNVPLHPSWKYHYQLRLQSFKHHERG